MSNNRIYIETPITETEGLEDGRYIVQNSYGRFEVSYSKQWSFHDEDTDCSDLTHYLRPLPEGTRVLQPGEVGVTEDHAPEFVYWLERAAHIVNTSDKTILDLYKEYKTKLAQQGK